MPFLPRLQVSLGLFVASFTLATSGQAQLLTANTLTAFDPGFSYTNGTQLSANAATQTFSNITGITDLTLRFVTQDSTSFGTTAMSYTFESWLGAAPVSLFGTPTGFNIADSTAWTSAGAFKYLDVTFDLSSVATGLTPASSYGFTVLKNLTAPDIRVARALGGDATYADGTGFESPFGSSFATINPTVAINADYIFQGAMTPVPEASTISVLFAGLFTGTMVFIRTRRRRETTTAAVST